MNYNEYLDLIEIIKRHNKAYYDNDNPEITDAEYDRLTQRLKAAEQEHPEWVSNNSPTQSVGGSIAASKFDTTHHIVPLLSLNDIFSLQEISDWHNTVNRYPAVVEHKIDGLTAALTYIDGKLVLGATRGDGHDGEIITEQCKQVRDIPHTLKLPAGVSDHNVLIVRVEVYQPTAEFERCNEEQALNGKKLFANPRNCAAGGLRTDNPAVTKERGLAAIAFAILYAEGWDDILMPCKPCNNQQDDIILLNHLGFNGVKQYACMDTDSILHAIEQINIIRSTLPYWIDGAVVKINSRKHQNIFGATSKYPLHAVAYKYPAEIKETTVREINVTVGRTGVLTPVATFDPISLAGTTVTHATLHNQKYLDERSINIGSVIQVLKSGEIIPKVVGVIKPSDEPFKIKTCPVCGTPAILFTDENGTDNGVYGCPNFTDCPAQKSRYIEFFCSRDVMDIDGMGPSVINKLIEAGLLNSVTDLYELQNHHDEIVALDKFGEKKFISMVNAIEESKANDIDRLIKALGISGVGRHIGKELAARYADMDAIINLSIDDLKAIDGIGDISAKAIVSFWNDPDCMARYQKLVSYGINTQSLAFLKPDKGTIFNGMTFVITGTLPTMSRDEAKTLIENNGGKVSDSVSKKTTYLVAGDEAGSKLAKARDLNVPILTENNLLNMLI